MIASERKISTFPAYDYNDDGSGERGTGREDAPLRLRNTHWHCP